MGAHAGVLLGVKIHNLRTLHKGRENSLACASINPHPRTSTGGGRGAGEEIRTLDILVGNEMLYQLSYARNYVNYVGRNVGEGGAGAQGFFPKKSGGYYFPTQ